MKIAILSRDGTLYSCKRLREAAIQRGHLVEILDPLSCYMNINPAASSIHYKAPNIPHFVPFIPRIVPTFPFFHPPNPLPFYPTSVPRPPQGCLTGVARSLKTKRLVSL
ncbi:hypothetical protein ACISSW_19595, partial [Escherichia coli]